MTNNIEIIIEINANSNGISFCRLDTNKTYIVKYDTKNFKVKDFFNILDYSKEIIYKFDDKITVSKDAFIVNVIETAKTVIDAINEVNKMEKV